MERTSKPRDAAADACRIGLIDSLDGEWFKLPLAAMQDVGPATQTLAGLLKVANKETFVPVSTIAQKARLPVKTVRNQLDALADAGWIVNAGRERTRRGTPRRTCTIKITKRTSNAMEAAYSVLPGWACCQPRRCHRLSWSAKAVLSLVMARLMSLKKAVEDQDGHGLDAEDIWGSIANMGDADRFRFSLASLERDTGLSRESIVAAKRELKRRKIINWYRTERDDGSRGKDILEPSAEFRVVVTPAGEGRCFVEF